jgi:hypothetical protein
MEIITNTFKGNNKIVNAYESNKTGVVLETSPNNPFRLHRFKKKYNVEVTGKQVGNKYVIVFWDKLTSIIK